MVTGKRLLFLKLLLGVILLLLASGCGQQEAQQPGNEAKTTGPAGQGAPQTVAEIALYQGNDRQQLLEEGAKREGKVVFYASMNENTLQPLMEAFEKKYPFIKAEYWRGGEVPEKAVPEFKAGRHVADLFEVDQNGELIMKREGVTTPFYSKTGDELPAGYKDPEGYWKGIYQYTFALQYNPSLVSKDEVPKTYQDLLDPKWQGKIAIEESDVEWFHTLWNHLGSGAEDYFAQLRAQQLQVRKGHTGMGRLIAAGEVAMSPTQYSSVAARIQSDGAPIDWIYLEPVVYRLNMVTMAKNAPHPHAALLLADFVVSEEGQKLEAEYDQQTVHPKVTAKNPKLSEPFKGLMADANAMVDEYDKWQKLYQEKVLAGGQ